MRLCFNINKINGTSHNVPTESNRNKAKEVMTSFEVLHRGWELTSTRPMWPMSNGSQSQHGIWTLGHTEDKTENQQTKHNTNNLTNRTNHKEGATWTQSGTSTPSQRTRMATPSDKTSETCDTKVCKVYPSVQGLQKLKNSRKPR